MEKRTVQLYVRKKKLWDDSILMCCFFRLFATIDKNKDGLLEKKELDLILAVTMVDGQENKMAKMVDQIMQEYDVDHDDMLTLDEFLNGLRKWCKELNLHRQSSIKAEVRRHLLIMFFKQEC